MGTRFVKANNSTNKYMNLLKQFFKYAVLVYLLLYMLPFPIDKIPFVDEIINYYNLAFDQLVIFVGAAVFGISDLQNIESGSGDTLFYYVRLATLLVFSLLIAIIITALRKDKSIFPKLKSFVYKYAQYYVGLYLFVYAIPKLFCGQFATPLTFDFVYLEKTYGESSPMGLFWNFIGASAPYQFIGGLFELLAGFLILFNRTKVVGAFITISVMLNVVIINFCYDIPVKIFSTHIVMITFFVIYPEIRVLIDFFIRQLPAKLSNVVEGERSLNWKINLLIVLALSSAMNYKWIAGYLEYKSKIVENETTNAVYIVEKFYFDNDSLGVVVDSLRWKKMFFNSDRARIIYANDSISRYKIKINTKNKIITFFSRVNEKEKYDLNYAENNGKYFLTGTWKGRIVNVLFKKKTRNDYLLINRGFHWINDIPFSK